MASYMSSIIDVLVTDVLEYLGGPVPPSTASSSPPGDPNNIPPVYYIPHLTDAPTKHKQKPAAAYSHLSWYAVATAVTALLLMLMLCRRCHRRKRTRVAFAGVANHSHNTGLPKCRRMQVSASTVPGESAPLVSRHCTVDKTSGETLEQQPKVSLCPASSNASSDPETTTEAQPDTDSCRVKEGVKRKLEEGAGSVVATGKKNLQGAWFNSQKLMKEPPPRLYQHAYTYASPHRRMFEVVKYANTASYRSDDIKSRWKGSFPRSRLNKIRGQFPRDVLQSSSVKRTSAHVRDYHPRKQRNMNYGAAAGLHTSSHSSPFSKPLCPKPTQIPHQLSRNAHQRSSPEKRKMVKRSKTLGAGADNSGVGNFRADVQKGKEKLKTNQDWSSVSKNKDTLATNFTQKSPRKIKKSSVLLKGKKLSGQRKAKRARKKHKLKENLRTMTIAIERVTFPDRKTADNYCQFPDPYQGVHVPAVVRQPSPRGTRAESFTIKRTATPVLSSLLGQGAFRTCWPHSENKSVVHTQELDGDGNTGRHNTNFLGPKFPDCNNETSEGALYSRTKHNVIWGKCVQESRPHKRCDSTVKRAAHKGFVFTGNTDPKQNSCFHFPKIPTSEPPKETQECRNIFNIVKNKDNTLCQNLRLGENKVNNVFKSNDNHKGEQFCASSHAGQQKQQKECWDSSNRLISNRAGPSNDLTERESIHVNIKAQPSNVKIKPHEENSKGSDWNLTSQCPHASSNRKRFETSRIPEAWVPEDKQVQISSQPKDPNISIHREDLGKRCITHNAKCSQQGPCVSFLTGHPEDRHALSKTNPIVWEKQQKDNVKHHSSNIKNPAAKLRFHYTHKPQATALPQGPNNAAPVDFKEFRNLWDTEITHEGNVFRFTRNPVLPPRFTYDNSHSQQEPLNSRPVREVKQSKCGVWQDSEENTLTLGQRFEGNKGRSTRATDVCRDENRECSKQLDNIHAQRKNGQLSEEMQAVCRVRRKDEHKCLEKKQTRDFSAGNGLKDIRRQGISSKVQENPNTPDDSPAVEEWADLEVRVFDRLSQSSSSAPATVDDDAESESRTEKQREVKGKLAQATLGARSHRAKNQVGKHLQRNSRRCDCRHHQVTCHGRDENGALDHETRHEVKSHKCRLADKPATKGSVVHGHVVKRNTSLISVRNMLNELTAHLRVNPDNNNSPNVPTHVRKPRGKTLYYFKPTQMTRKDQQSSKEDDRSSLLKSTCPDSHGDNPGTGEYVKCYRSRKFKAYRHEPYRKRVPTSSESTVTPSSGYYWTRNKNNCSPSRKGRYVLGPLVDKHVFPEEHNNSDVGTAEDSGSNSVIGREDNRGIVSARVGGNTQEAGRIILDNGQVKQEETDHSDVEEETKECHHTGFTTPVFTKPRPVRVGSQDKAHVDVWNHADFRVQQIRHATAWPAATAQPADEDSRIGRVSRGHIDARQGHPAETKYQIIRQYCGGYPEASQTIKRQEPAGHSTKWDTAAKHVMKVCTAKRNICQSQRNTYVECKDKEISHRDPTSKRYTDMVHVVRHDNPTDLVAETNDLAEATSHELKQTEDASSSMRRQRGQLIIRQNFIRQEKGKYYTKNTEQQPATKKPASEVSVLFEEENDVDAEDASSLDRPTTSKHMTNRTEACPCDDKDHHLIAKGHDLKHEAVLCSEDDPKSTGSLNIGEKSDYHNERNHQLRPDTLELPNCSQIKAETETGGKYTSKEEDNKPSLLSTGERAESKSKSVSRPGCSRQQNNRLNIVKTHMCLARLKGSRGPVSRRCVGPLRETKSTKVGVLSGRAGRLQMKNTKLPATQSHTTQTENSMISAHVGVQTSPGLQVLAKRTPRPSKMRRYPINTRLGRDRVTHKDSLLSRNSVYKKPYMNALNSLSNSAAQPVQISAHTSLIINRNKHVHDETVLESRTGTREKHNPTLGQAVTDKQLQPSATAREKDFSNDQKYKLFEDHSRNDKASNSEKLQDTTLNEIRNTQANSGHGNECVDRNELIQQGMETVSDSSRWEDKQKDSMFIFEFSNTHFSGTQNAGYPNDTSLSNLESKENEQLSTGKISCQTNKDLQTTSELSEDREFSSAGATPRSNRIRALASSDSSALSSRLSELNRFCVIRPIWKNANIEEIDRRVRRALKLREELKRSGSSGSRARSLIASYVEASAAEHTRKSSDGLRSGASSTFASDYDSTNRSTYPISRDQRTSFQDTASDDTLCQKGERVPITGGRSSSSEDNNTKQGDEVCRNVVIETPQPGISVHWANREMDSAAAAAPKTQENTDNEQRLGVRSRIEHPLSSHDETVSESVSRREIPTGSAASRRPSNSNSGNSIKRAAMRNKNSPPTKISKVENISNNTPRLVGALVQTLPQVPLTSFVEWFIETSDPNNFLPSDRPSSSSDNSPGDSAHCGFDEGTPKDDQDSSKMWQTLVFNKPHEREDFDGNNKQPRSVSITPHRHTYLQDNPTSNKSADQVSSFAGTKPKCFEGEGVPAAWKSCLQQSISSTFPSTPSSATYGVSTLSGDTEERSDLVKNTAAENNRQKLLLGAVKEGINILNCPFKPQGEENLSNTIMKELCSKLASKRIKENSLSSIQLKQIEKSRTPKHVRPVSRRQHDVESEEPTTPDSFTETASFQRPDSCTYSYPASKTDLQVAQTTDDGSSGQIYSESTEDNAFLCKTNHDKTAKVYYGAKRNEDSVTDSKMLRTFKENAETEPSVGSSCTSEQGDVSDKQAVRDPGEDSRCAPGIRHIMMKLRQTKELEEFPVPRAERTKITLRKCSDVTGIIARFQNTQP